MQYRGRAGSRGSMDAGRTALSPEKKSRPFSAASGSTPRNSLIRPSHSGLLTSSSIVASNPKPAPLRRGKRRSFSLPTGDIFLSRTFPVNPLSTPRVSASTSPVCSGMRPWQSVSHRAAPSFQGCARPIITAFISRLAERAGIPNSLTDHFIRSTLSRSHANSDTSSRTSDESRSSNTPRWANISFSRSERPMSAALSTPARGGSRSQKALRKGISVSVAP